MGGTTMFGDPIVTPDAMGPLPSPPLDPIKAATLPYAAPNAAAEYQLKQAQAEKARADAAQQQKENADKQQKYHDARTASLTEVKRVTEQIDGLGRMVHENGGWWQLGKTGALTRDPPVISRNLTYPGSDAANFDEAVKPIESNTAFDRLQAMRQASPTGGAVGNVSDNDMALLKSTIASLNASQDYTHFMHNLAVTKDAYYRVLAKLDPKEAEQFLTKEGIWKVPSGGFYYGRLPQNVVTQVLGHSPAAQSASSPSNDHPVDIEAIMQKYGAR